MALGNCALGSYISPSFRLLSMRFLLEACQTKRLGALAFTRESRASRFSFTFFLYTASHVLSPNF